MAPTVSVLTLNYRNPKATIACVEHFLRQTIADDLEIIVIDNHSLDDSVGVLRNHFGDCPNVRIVETSRNGGFGSGYNIGASYATGEYLLINNPDKLVPDNGVEVLLSEIQADKSVGILSPKIVHPDGTRRLSMRTFPRLIDVIARRSIIGTLFPKRLNHYLLLDRDPDVYQTVDWVVGGCFVIAKQLFDDLHGFDERFFLFFEDTDLCKRVSQKGLSIAYTPSVTVQDKKYRLSGERFSDLLFKKTGRIHVLSALKYFWKWRKTAH